MPSSSRQKDLTGKVEESDTETETATETSLPPQRSFSPASQLLLLLLLLPTAVAARNRQHHHNHNHNHACWRKVRFDVPQGTAYLKGELPEGLPTETVRILDVAPPSYRGNTTLLIKQSPAGLRREIRLALDDGRLAILSADDDTVVRSPVLSDDLARAEQVGVSGLYLEVYILDERGNPSMLDGNVTENVTLFCAETDGQGHPLVLAGGMKKNVSLFGDARACVRPVSAHRQRQVYLGHTR
ncbi:hypothetical protein HDU87_002612 [Geranomyces variabilis]|uniref:Uncharacterized protein n=1 Tax=Geranomyces variabilis TaxID=109894 RepID=A0AAD5XR78_9FUNG|nr:hypothetical protein HDU87_002612 [Geranomyces variabilis]